VNFAAVVDAAAGQDHTNLLRHVQPPWTEISRHRGMCARPVLTRLKELSVMSGQYQRSAVS